MSDPTKLSPWQVIRTKIIHATPWIEVKEDTCLADGTELTYTYTRRIDEGPLIIAEDQDEKLWLVRQYRHPIKKIIWQFPAEGKHPAESWQAAAQRGLGEELGLLAQTWHDLGTFFVDPGGLEQKYHAYLATGLSQTNEFATYRPEDVTEKLEVTAFSRPQIDDLIAHGAICDNWTLTGLFLYDHYKAKQSSS